MYKNYELNCTIINEKEVGIGTIINKHQFLNKVGLISKFKFSFEARI